MRIWKLKLPKFGDLLRRLTDRGVIDGDKVISILDQYNILPKHIKDVRGNLRLAIAQAEDGDIEVTEFLTDAGREAWENEQKAS